MQRLVPSIFPSLWWSSSTTGSTSCRRASPHPRPSPSPASRATVAHPARRPPCTPYANPPTRRTTIYTSPTTMGTPAATSHVSIELPLFNFLFSNFRFLTSCLLRTEFPVLLNFRFIESCEYLTSCFIESCDYLTSGFQASSFIVYRMEFDKTRWSCSWNSDQIEHKTLPGSLFVPV